MTTTAPEPQDEPKNEDKQNDLEQTEQTQKPDDDQLAVMIADEWRGKVIYLHNEWYVYERGAWRKRQLQSFHMALRKQLRKYRWQGVTVSSRLIRAIAGLLEMDLFVSDEQYNAQQAKQDKYIALQNGLLNLETMKLEADRPDLYTTHQMDYEFDPSAECPNWMRYVRSSLVHPDDEKTGRFEVDPLLIMLLQEALAYSLTSRTDLKASFWLVGAPDSGKSTMVSFLRSLTGEWHTTIDLNQLGQNRFLLSSIVGKRVVTFTEASESSVLPDALYKAMVGGQDEVYADVKNKPGIAFRPSAKFWWAMNGAPRVTDRSGATLNRLYVIPFNRSIPPDQRIGDLNERLKAERSGILNWLLIGYERLLKRGKFLIVPQSLAWKERYRRDNDTEATFVEEQCETGEEYSTKASKLYQAYAQWCKDFGYRSKNLNQAAKEWERLGFHKIKRRDANYWSGVMLKPVDEM